MKPKIFWKNYPAALEKGLYYSSTELIIIPVQAGNIEPLKLLKNIKNMKMKKNLPKK